MQTTVHGIHHVTAVAGDAQQNLDFYVGILGIRMVKKTVNQDALHIYAAEKGMRRLSDGNSIDRSAC